MPVGLGFTLGPVVGGILYDVSLLFITYPDDLSCNAVYAEKIRERCRLKAEPGRFDPHHNSQNIHRYDSSTK